MPITSTHTVRQSADVINATRKHGEDELNRLLCAIERHHGREHLVEAHALALELYEQEFPRYVITDGVISEQFSQHTGWRFYCYEAAWRISPAAQAGHVYRERNASERNATERNATERNASEM